MSRFALDISVWVAKAKDRMDEVARSALISISAELVKGSPVGDAEKWAANIERKERDLPPLPAGYVGGRFRANWQMGVGAPVSGTLPDIDPDGLATAAALVDALPQQAAGKIYYITNNLPYAQRLEDGWSGQAPSGMVGLAVVRWQGLVAECVANLPR